MELNFGILVVVIGDKAFCNTYGVIFIIECCVIWIIWLFEFVSKELLYVKIWNMISNDILTRI